jgi:hypothetical protein
MDTGQHSWFQLIHGDPDNKPLGVDEMRQRVIREHRSDDDLQDDEQDDGDGSLN